MGKRLIGRPGTVGPEQLAKLEEAYRWDWSDQKACDYAGISVDALYRYQKKHPDFRKRKEFLKNSPAENAMRNIAESIENGDLKTSQWYLEKRDERFNPKTQVDVNIQHSLSADEITQRLAELVAMSRARTEVEVIEAEVEEIPALPDNIAADNDECLEWLQ